MDHVLAKWQAAGKLDRPSFVAKTVVTTDLLAELAKEYGVEVRETLTGFKFIAEAIRQEEGKLQYVAGGEESYGYLVGDAVRDKDAVQAAACWRSLPTSWTGRARPCWAVWPRSTSATRRTRRVGEPGQGGRNGKAEIDAMMKGSARRPHRNWRGGRGRDLGLPNPRSPQSARGSAPRVAPSGVQRHAICDGRGRA